MQRTTRRGLVMGGLATAAGAALTGCGFRRSPAVLAADGRDGEATQPAFGSGTMPGPAEAWRLLVEGNRRWVRGRLEHPNTDLARRRQVAAGQHPFATVISCIDSRLPPEFVFDRGVGDLFVVRTGAETVCDVVTGSLEYGPVEDHTPLIVVLGHQRCGAITAAEHALSTGHPLPGSLQAIATSLRAAYDAARGRRAGDLIDEMVRQQVYHDIAALRADQQLAPMIASNTLAVVGAYYSLDTGRVDPLTPTP